jgi:hypothetical protein
LFASQSWAGCHYLGLHQRDSEIVVAHPNHCPGLYHRRFVGLVIQDEFAGDSH